MAPLAFCSSPAILKAGFSLVSVLFDGLLFVRQKVAFILSVCLSSRLKCTWMASPAMVAEQQKINSDLVFKTAMMVLNSNCLNKYFNNNSYSLFYISSILDVIIKAEVYLSFISALRSISYKVIFLSKKCIVYYYIKCLRFRVCGTWYIYPYRT